MEGGNVHGGWIPCMTKNIIFFNVLDHKLIDLFSRKSSPSSDSEDLIVIREIYDSENAQEIFEIELERAIQVSSY